MNVPVYFHVVTDGAIGESDGCADRRSVERAEPDFRGGEGGADTGFKFKLAGVTRTDNAAWFYGGPGGKASTP